MSQTHVEQRVQAIVDRFHDAGLSAAEQFCDQHDTSRIAFTFVDAAFNTHDITYGALGDRSRRMATVLQALGVREGDRVATLLGKGLDLPSIMLGAWRLGAVYVPLFTAFASEAVNDRLSRAEVKVVVTDEQQRSKIGAGPWRVLISGDAVQSEALEPLCREAAPWAGDTPTGPQVPIVHMFTSGTTGKPKAVVHPKAYAAGWLSYLEHGLGTTGDSVYWCAADPGWAYGLYAAIVAPLAAGIRSVMTTATFKPAATWGVLARLGVTDFAAAPTALRAMKNSDGHVDLPGLRRISCAGEPLTPDVLQWTQELGAPAHDHFGQTEIGMTAGFPQHPQIEVPIQPRAMGVSLPGWSMVVLDADGTLASDGVMGRLAVDIARSPFFTFNGYGVDRDLRADRFVGGGAYYVTGDLVTRKEGLLHFSARDDDVILMAGYRIGPFEIESVLLKHPAIREAAVVAAPDEVRGEVVCAFVVLAEKVEGNDNLVSELQQWVKDGYGTHAYPRRVLFCDALPKTESGKIQRVALRRELANAPT